MKAYISGKITGDPNYREKFQAMKESMEREGHIVLNPAQLPEGMTAADYMRVNFAMIDVADVVLLLPDWSNSKGAQLEKAYCEYIGKKVVLPDESYWEVPCSRR